MSVSCLRAGFDVAEKCLTDASEEGLVLQDDFTCHSKILVIDIVAMNYGFSVIRRRVVASALKKIVAHPPKWITARITHDSSFKPFDVRVRVRGKEHNFHSEDHQ